MPSVAYALVFDALYDLVDATVSDLRVTDGYDLSDDREDVLQLGVPNLNDTSEISEGSFNQEQIAHGAAGYVKETGSINCVVFASIGDSDDRAASTIRGRVFGYIDALAQAIRANRSLGVTDFDLVVGALVTNGDVASDKVDGATCAISFTVNYTALLGA